MNWVCISFRKWLINCNLKAATLNFLFCVHVSIMLISLSLLHLIWSQNILSYTPKESRYFIVHWMLLISITHSKSVRFVVWSLLGYGLDQYNIQTFYKILVHIRIFPFRTSSSAHSTLQLTSCSLISNLCRKQCAPVLSYLTKTLDRIHTPFVMACLLYGGDRKRVRRVRSFARFISSMWNVWTAIIWNYPIKFSLMPVSHWVSVGRDKTPSDDISSGCLYGIYCLLPFPRMPSLHFGSHKTHMQPKLISHSDGRHSSSHQRLCLFDCGRCHTCPMQSGPRNVQLIHQLAWIWACGSNQPTVGECVYFEPRLVCSPVTCLCLANHSVEQTRTDFNQKSKVCTASRAKSVSHEADQGPTKSTLTAVTFKADAKTKKYKIWKSSSTIRVMFNYKVTKSPYFTW